MLYQPSNIIPDRKNSAEENGVADSSLEYLPISFQINGSSGVKKIEIKFYDNTSTSTYPVYMFSAAYSSPVYGTDYDGTILRHTVTIKKSSASSLFALSEVKYIITLYYTENGTDKSITQSSPSVFIFRTPPTVSVAAFATGSRECKFQATYTQAEGDSLRWVRWQFAHGDTDDTREIIRDTGCIYGAGKLLSVFDGIMSGEKYSIKCTVQTSNGIEADSGWVSFSTTYTQTEVVGSCEAAVADDGRSAIKITWNGFKTIFGKTTGGYQFQNGYLIPSSGTNITWDNVNETAMSFTAPWNFFYAGKLAGENVVLFKVTDASGGIYQMAYEKANRNLYLRLTYMLDSQETLLCEINTESSENPLDPYSDVQALITPSKWYVNVGGYSSGRFPSSSLYPGTELYPAIEDDYAMYNLDGDNSVTQAAMTSIQICGKQYCDYMQVVTGTLDSEVVDKFISFKYEVAAIDGTVYFLNCTNSLDAGTMYIGNVQISGWEVYRKSSAESYMRKLCTTGLLENTVYDYSAKSQVEEYKYYIYPFSKGTYISSALTTEAVCARFWNWTILECEETSDSEIYKIVNEFSFGKNLESSDMNNNNKPQILSNFTKYPTVFMSNSDYLSGTFSSLIGEISIINGSFKYADSIELRDKIRNLSTTTNKLFLKTRKGDFIRIRIAGEINFTTMDNTAEQALTVSIPWVEVADASRSSVVDY